MEQIEQIEQIKQIKQIETDEIKISSQAAHKQIENILGSGTAIHSMLDLAKRYAQLNCPVLLEGETGSGKREVVLYMHSIGPRSGKKLVTIDCAAIPLSIIESELFGHKKGAFTDARTNRIGQIEAANGSTLFLDNIDCLPISLQQNLLRVIEEQVFTRVGDHIPIKVDIRIIAAGNRNFKQLIETNLFRKDLYFRFYKTIKVPNLTVRKDDMDFFMDKFLKEYANELGKKGVRIGAEAKKLIKNHPWAGNIRQLMHFMHQLVVRVDQVENTKCIIPTELVKTCLDEEMVLDEYKTIPDNGNDFTLETALNQARKNAIDRALEKTNGNNEDASALLGITRDTFFRLKKLTI